MTNIIAAITVALVTNTATVLPTRQILVPCPGATSIDANGISSTLAIACWETVPVKDPTNRTHVTTCTEVTTLKFDWNGPREVKSERALWSTSVVERLEWVKP